MRFEGSRPPIETLQREVFEDCAARKISPSFCHPCHQTSAKRVQGQGFVFRVILNREPFECPDTPRLNPKGSELRVQHWRVRTFEGGDDPGGIRALGC